MADDQDKSRLPESDVPAAQDRTDGDDLPGERLADDDLMTPGEEYQVAPDEDEAEELDSTAEETGEVVDDEEQLTGAERVARVAVSTRPVRRLTPAADAPTKKGKATPRRSGDDHRARANPVQFVRESAGELSKVVWPTATQLRQYFIVVLVFVLLVIAYVSALDLLFGWSLLKLFG